MKRRPKPDLERLGRTVIYDPANGNFYSRKTGRIHRAKSRGYMQVLCGKHAYPAHMLAWYLYYGRWPHLSIDHIDSDRGNNKIANLRLLSHSANVRTGSRQYASSTGVRGVAKHSLVDKYVAYICVDGKRIHLGMHATIEEAASARKRAEETYGLR